MWGRDWQTEFEISKNTVAWNSFREGIIIALVLTVLQAYSCMRTERVNMCNSRASGLKEGVATDFEISSNSCRLKSALGDGDCILAQKRF